MIIPTFIRLQQGKIHLRLRLRLYLNKKIFQMEGIVKFL